ncbi:membrane protein, partial [Mycobacterium sp. ITM-2017-0098]
MGMRPAAKMPKLTRRSRFMIGAALVAVLLLLLGPRFIDTYVDWLWFGELGYRSVFTTQIVTRLIIFFVVAILLGALVFAALALAYRTRPVFVPTVGPNDPIARYRTAVMTRLRLVGIGVPAFIGVLAGFVAQSYWQQVQLYLHGGSFGVADPQFGIDLGFYAFDLPFYRLVLS